MFYKKNLLAMIEKIYYIKADGTFFLPVVNPREIVTFMFQNGR